MSFEFSTAQRIIFGEGVLRQAAPEARRLGRCALLLSGRKGERGQALAGELERHGLAASLFSIPAEPTVTMVREAVYLGVASGCDLVIAIGGGSVLDAGKAAAALIGNGGDPFDYLEVIGKGQPLSRPSLPFIAIPTTAGTGSEATRNAVLSSPEHGVKVSLRGPTLLPALAIVDPELTYSLPPGVTAHSGLDALAQLIEPYTSCRANPLVDPLCLSGIEAIAWALRRAFRQGDDITARAAMARASLFGGMALANAGLGVVHGLAGPIGGSHGAAHGAICAALLPEAMGKNIEVLRQRDPDGASLRRYREIARLVTRKADAEALDGVRWVRQLVADLGVPTLRAYGISETDLPELAVKGMVASSTKGNPIALSEAELLDILRRS